jgi:hypothetical protein
MSEPIPPEPSDPPETETALDVVLRLTAGNPRFQEAPPADKAFTLVGARPPTRAGSIGSQADRRQPAPQPLHLAPTPPRGR